MQEPHRHVPTDVRHRQLAPPGTIHLLVVPDAHSLDVAAPAQVLGHPLVDVPLVYISMQACLRSAQGLQLADLAPLPDAEPASTLAAATDGVARACFRHPLPVPTSICFCSQRMRLSKLPRPWIAP